MATRPDIADALAQAAREINSPRDLESTLDGIDHVGISIAYRDGKIETKAGTDQLVWELDALQYDLGEGPCVHAIKMEPVTVVNDLHHEQRWPYYVPRAIGYGLKAQMGVRLFVDGQTVGGLNLYSTDGQTIDPDLVHTAELFAAHAALALGRARREEDLNSALASRKTIGQAIGIVMERYQLDEERAFQYLVRVSQHSNIKLRDVAQEIVAQGNDRRQLADN
jgi:GAF domain-containing protein